MSISNKKPSPRYIISIQGTRLDLRLIILPFITLALISLSIFFLWTGDILFIDNIVDLIYKIFPYPRASDISSLIYNTLLFLSTLLYIYMLILGIINAILIIPLVILGFTLPNKTQSEKNIKYDERSGDKNGSVPKEIQVWNWGAACFSYVWAISHGLWSVLWSVLLIPIPVVNIFVFIILGLKGNKWAWRGQRWESVEQFTEEQSKWKNPFGLFVFILLIIVFSLYAFSILSFLFEYIINPILP
jgi:hypothetical protein